MRQRRYRSVIANISTHILITVIANRIWKLYRYIILYSMAIILFCHAVKKKIVKLDYRARRRLGYF